MLHPGEFLRIHAEVETKVNLSKCKILRPQVTYLGHLVSHQRVELIPDCTFLRSIFGLLLQQAKSDQELTGYRLKPR